ncbi:unnamed protein product [Auanema sp. JU1783]|nr:unnamed protein product [Auanema sp. JU1783]
MADNSKFQVDFYYDVFSPYSWIALEGLLRYEKVWPISLKLKPFCLRDIMIATGNRPPAVVLARAMNMLKDIQRNNEFWGMKITPPAKFQSWLKNKSTTTEVTQKTLIVLQHEQPEKLLTVSRGFWKRMWNDGKPIFQRDDILTVLKDCGVENFENVYERALSCPKIAEELKANTTNALDEGAYGAPWIVVHKDGETHAFFGSDRFHFIAQLIGQTFSDGLIRFSSKL